MEGAPSLAKALTPAEWLPKAFYDLSHREHHLWSLTSLKDWLTSQRPHIHAPSRSVYGGPLGVRNLLFALSRISQNLADIEEGLEVPSGIQQCIRRREDRWDSTKARRTLDECVAILHADISRSNDVLRVTLDERSEAWERAIEEAGIATMTAVEQEQGGEIGITATSGVPQSSRSIQSMLSTIRARRAAATENADDHEVSVIMEERLRVPEIADTSRSGVSDHTPQLTTQMEGMAPAEPTYVASRMPAPLCQLTALIYRHSRRRSDRSISR